MKVKEMSISQLIACYEKEKSPEFLEAIVARIVTQNLNKEEVDKIWDFASDNQILILFFILVEYIDRKIVIEEIVAKKDEKFFEKLTIKLGALSQEEANQLIKSSNEMIRKFAAPYISREAIIEQLLIEKSVYVIYILLRNLENLTQEEADYLMSSDIPYIIKKQVAPYVSRNMAMKQSITEDKIDILQDFIVKLGDLTEKEAINLLKAKHWLIREYAISYVSRKIAFKQAIIEESEKVVQQIVIQLGKVTEDEANQLVKAEHWKIREYVVPYISQELVIDQLLVEKIGAVIKRLFEKLGILNRDISNVLIKANSWRVRSMVSSYVDRQVALEQALVEDDEIIVQALITRLNELTKQEANQLMKSKNKKLKEFAVPYASYHEVIKSLPYETDEYVSRAIAKRILEKNK